ncbi:MAG: helix-turn-helix domain containing protein [Firmicutes bacterium]|nr:helix-turn-helix domain containing protein [Bacillota bacterium]
MNAYTPQQRGERVKTADQKAEFIELRAKGVSYSSIAEQLHISKSTCTTWERELKSKIEELKGDRLNELYTLYAMDKESRIKRLGTALTNIDKALAQKDLTDLPADALLKLKLKYEQELRAEYTETTAQSFIELSVEEIIEALTSLYRKQESGIIGPAQAKAQLATLTSLLAAEKLKDSQDLWTV